MSITSMVSITKTQVPAYLRTSDFYNSLSSDDDEEFSIPTAYFKPTLSLFNIPEDVFHLLHTIKFWGLKRFPRELMDFFLTKPSSVHAYEQVCSVLPEFDDDFNLSGMYKAISNSDPTRSNKLHAAVLCGREDFLEYLVSFNKNATLAVVKEAAEYGLLELLQHTVTLLRLKGGGKTPFTQVCLKKVAGNGHTECLRFLLEQGCVPDRGVSLAAAEYGHLGCLQLANEYHCGLGSKVINAAALHGHLPCLTYLLEQGCPLDRTSAYNAALHGHLNCLSLLIDHDAPLTKRMCNAAAMNGHLSCLQLLFERGCPWDKECARLAVTHNHFDCLQFAVDNGCRCDCSVADAAAAGGNMQCLEYLQSSQKPASYMAVNCAARHGHTECLQLLFDAGVTWDNEVSTMQSCFRQRDDSFVRRLVDTGYALPADAAYLAAKCGCEKSLSFICSLDSHPLTTADAAIAARNGHLECLKVLHTHECPWDADTYINAVKNGHVECLQFAHEHHCPRGDSDTLCDTAAGNGHLSVLEYLHHQGYPLTVDTCLSAIRARSLPCLRFAVEHGAPVDDVRLCSTAAGGRARNASSTEKTLSILKYLHEEARCPWDEACPAAAVQGFDSTMLQYIHEQGCPWGMYTTTRAVQVGTLCCLQYALAQGCPCSVLTCVNAARERSDPCFLQALHEHGCPWNSYVTAVAARAGHLEVLRYAHEQGCRWDAGTAAAAAASGDTAIVQYVRDHGCPWDARTAAAAAQAGDLDMLKFVHQNDCPWDESVSEAAYRGAILSEERRLQVNECFLYCMENHCPIADSVFNDQLQVLLLAYVIDLRKRLTRALGSDVEG